MKKIIYILAATLMVQSCMNPNSLLDQEDVGMIREKDVFSNHIYAQQFLAEIYNNMMYYSGTNHYEHGSDWSGAFLDCATDNGEARNLESNAQKMNTGNWNALNVPMNNLWAKSYAQIRACNKLLMYCDQIPIDINEGFKLEDRNYIRAQAHFLRAYYYFLMVRAFGGVPVITTVLTDEEASALGRNTFAESVDFIVDDCEKAVFIFHSLGGLYEVNGSNYGRGNLGAALSIKAKMLTIAASPLFNRSATDPQYDSGDPNAKFWRYTDYDAERWKRAADACKEVIDLNLYGLFNSKEGTKTAYETMFVKRAPMHEGIIPILKGASNRVYYNNLPFNFMAISGLGTPRCYNLPTHNLVAAYEMKNGMLPEQPGSGYRPLNPTADRDPRLKSTIWHDEATFQGVEFATWRRYAVSQNENGKHHITGYSRTGYFLRKYMDVDQNPSGLNVTVPNTYLFLRYADILLSYAEALNEYHATPGANAEIAWAIDEIRTRATMPDLVTTFTNRGWTMTQENVRTQIQNERRIEFAFEEQRFWDIRRWLIGDQTQRAVHEMDIVLKDDNLTKVYSVRKIENRAWDDRMNLLPLPQAEVNKNSNLKQNWGWTPPRKQ